MYVKGYKTSGIDEETDAAGRQGTVSSRKWFYLFMVESREYSTV